MNYFNFFIFYLENFTKDTSVIQTELNNRFEFELPDLFDLPILRIESISSEVVSKRNGLYEIDVKVIFTVPVSKAVWLENFGTVSKIVNSNIFEHFCSFFNNYYSPNLKVVN